MDIFETLKACPYCRSEDIGIFLSAPDRLTKKKGKFFLSRCNNCGLVFQNPRVKEKLIDQFYTQELGYYHLPLPKESTLFVNQLKKIIYRDTLINHFGYSNLGKRSLLRKILTIPFKRKLEIDLFPRFMRNGKLLEIGCSYGGRLEKLKEIGWDVLGAEMDKKSAEFAQAKRGLNVQNKRAEELSFGKSSFDVVLMSMVLEHLYNPLKTLKKATNWLKPGGQLLFSIPYFGGFEFSVFKEYSYGLQLPTHITFFNEKILKEYLSKLGYKEIKFYFQYFDRDIVVSADYKHDATKKKLYRFISSNKIFRRLLIKPFVFILSLAGKTSRVSVIATKSD